MNEKAFLERLDTHNKLMRELIETIPPRSDNSTQNV